jgi:hypothetical protein
MSALNSRHSESIGQTGERSGDHTGCVGADFALAVQERQPVSMISKGFSI